jgi:hypothetical protein
MIVETTDDDFDCSKLTPVLLEKTGGNQGVLECNGQNYTNENAASRAVPVPAFAALAVALLLSVVLI